MSAVIIVTIISLAIGFVSGYFVGLRVGSQTKIAQAPTVEPVNPEQIQLKQTNKARILQLSDQEISNDKVERLLNVSNATAERCLDELEHEGKLIQIGKTGQSVRYKKA